MLNIILGIVLAVAETAQAQQTMPGNSIIAFTTPATPLANQMLIKVAMLIAQNDTDYGLARKNSALRNSGGAIPMALEQLWSDEILPQNVNFSFQWYYSNCNEANALGSTYQFIRNYGADAIIATPCMDVPPMLGHLATNFNLPMMVWGQSMASALASSNNATYPSLLNGPSQQTMPGNSIGAFTTSATPLANQTLIKVAMLIAQNDTDYGLARKNSALRNSGGAIPMALEQLWADEILPQNVNFSFQWFYGRCNEANALGSTYQFIRYYGADAIIATPCMDVPPMLGHLATNFNLPMMVWGQSMASALASSNNATYPSLLNVVPNYKYMASGVVGLLQYFNWTQFAFVIQSDTSAVSGGCNLFARDLDRALSIQSKTSITYKARIFNIKSSDTDTIVSGLMQRARIVLLCFDDLSQLRTFALNLFDGGLKTKSICLDYHFGSKAQDGRDADAEVIGRLAFFWHYDITLSALSNRNYYGFYERVVNRTRDWPFYCPESECGSVTNVMIDF
uniref:ANF_receptor domain-containing protein n=1 Tax=Globodera pallida TaxID=36090 RepID=A0A183C4Q0_GLOPA